MSSLKQRYENFADFMQQNVKGVEIGIYSISGALFALSYFTARPITKFTQSKHIPKHFIEKQIVQNGTIEAIEPAGSILRIDHKPPLNLFYFSRKTLPVKIFGVEINGIGHSWLQSVTLKQKVEFVPISAKNSNFAECQVKLLQDPLLYEKKSIDLAEALISLGFAKTTKEWGVASTDVQLQRYLKKLKVAQSKASRRGMPWPINILTSRISRFIYVKLFPPKYRLPKLVR